MASAAKVAAQVAMLGSVRVGQCHAHLFAHRAKPASSSAALMAGQRWFQVSGGRLYYDVVDVEPNSQGRVSYACA